MGEESHETHQELWEQYMEVERRELEQRRNGQLGRALPGESHEELVRIAEEDWSNFVAATRSGTSP
jgi:hypothetical protein